jgi:hypothetical protein
LDAKTCWGFNEHNKLLTTPLSISWFLSPINVKLDNKNINQANGVKFLGITIGNNR